MKHVKIKVTIDVTNQLHVIALNNLFKVLGNHQVVESAIENKVPKTEEPEKLLEAKKPDQKPLRKSKEVVEEKEQPKSSVEEKPQDLPKTEENTSDSQESSYKIEDIRPLLAKKVQDHRAAIKDKLTEFGAPNLTSLDSKHYSDFVEFLNSLK